jgi:hypothetical protein
MIVTTSSGILYQLRDIYSICRCFWNIARYKWEIHNEKIEMFSFGVVLFLTGPHCQIRGVGVKV